MLTFIDGKPTSWNSKGEFKRFVEMCPGPEKDSVRDDLKERFIADRYSRARRIVIEDETEDCGDAE